MVVVRAGEWPGSDGCSIACMGPQADGSRAGAERVDALEKRSGEHAGGEIRVDEGKRE